VPAAEFFLGDMTTAIQPDEMLHAAIVVRALPDDEAPGFQLVDDAGDVGGVAHQRIGQHAHRNRPRRVQHPQRVSLRRRQIELRAQRHPPVAGGEEEFHHRRPERLGLALVFTVGFLHRSHNVEEVNR